MREHTGRRQEEGAADKMDAVACAAAREAMPGLRLADFSAYANEHARLGPDALRSDSSAALGEQAALHTRCGGQEAHLNVLVNLQVPVRMRRPCCWPRSLRTRERAI